ncbi:MAG: carboxypeptidase-like regulatory domain-containing protein [Ignavibacteriaceae bacterium]|nr:carboxypeptidase-like regulatory domain-containing protein [Ignavibacteriaceae bacterium]
MRNVILSVLFTFMFVLLSNGCKKNDATAPDPPATGNLIGSVELRNENGDPASSYNAVTVSVEGTNLSSQTDSSGNYSITGIEQGVRIISFSKNGYGTYKSRINIDGTPYQYINLELYKLPSFNVNQLSAKIITNGIELTGEPTNSVHYPRGVVVFAFTDSTVCSDPSKYLYANNSMIYPDSINFTTSATVYELLQKGFKSGQTIYFVAYATISYNYYTNYFDWTYNKTVYTCISNTPSNKVSVKLP